MGLAMHKLDTSGLKCPLPIMRTKLEMSKLTSGEKMLIVATDDSFTVDCKVFTRRHGHKLVRSWQSDQKHYFILEAS